jgi:protein-disulfide isomerase
VADKYSFKDKLNSDPLLTKVPDLKEMLAGPIISVTDPSLGPTDAPVILVEFADYACEYCQKQEKILQEIIRLYPGKVRLIWKDYPETNESSSSFQAAQAARCAGEQNQFWPYHDLLFQANQLKLTNFLELAQQLNFDVNQFKQCLASEQVKTLIKDNIEEANALAITGIPFIYVNNQEVMGNISLEDLKKIIETELRKK